ncbi:MAG: Gfo/Idh/MocA family protein [Puniceicoccaceae bacterium]
MNNTSSTPSQSGYSRRQFIKTSLGAGALLGFPTIIPATALGKNGAVAPSERVNLGVLACGGRSAAAAAYQEYAKSQIVAVCDPVLERRLEKAQKWGVSDHYSDFRDVLARPDVDAVHISTADHWHVPMSLMAARAGKDVYCEKPLGLSIEQDIAARDIVHKYGRVFQYGTQQRSMDACRMGIELVLNGHIGDVKEIYVWAPQGFAGGSATPVMEVPDGFDYDLWLGPAPEAPFCHDRCLNMEFDGKAIWFVYDYAIGFLGGWGAHPLDILQWWADEEGMDIPVEYKATGTIPTEGLHNTVTHWDMESTYANGLKMRFMDTVTAKAKGAAGEIPYFNEIGEKAGNCTHFIGEKGWIRVTRGVFQTSDEKVRRLAKDPGPRRLTKSQNHLNNFVDSVLSREQPVSNVDSAIRSDIISHMGDLSIRTGKRLGWDPVKETVTGSSKARKMMHREIRKPWTL